MLKKTAAVGVALGVGFSGLVVVTTTPASAASTYYACVKKKTGETKVVKKKKKCKKGWKKVKWSAKGTPGASGPQGPAGPLLSVKDGNGAVVGPFLGTWSGLIPGFTVMIDGGIWDFGTDGVLDADQWDSPSFTAADCTGPVQRVTRFVYDDDDNLDPAASVAKTAQAVAQYVPNGPGRQVYRPDSVGAAARAWKVSGPNVAGALNQSLYELDDMGNCQLQDTLDAVDVAAGATLVGLTEVPVPGNVPGPLTVG